MLAARTPALLFGADYHPEHWPEEIWREDARLMVDAGINVVVLGLGAWPRLQPAPDTFAFDWLERAFAVMHEYGIRVGLATGTEAFPRWLSRETGCPHHPVVLQRAEVFLRELASRFGKHPALLFWQIQREPRRPACAADCEYCVAGFRRWIQQKYKTLDVLNEHWNAAASEEPFTAWEEITVLPAGPGQHPTRVLDYRRFVSDAALGIFLREKSLLSEVTPEVRVTTRLNDEQGISSSIDGFQWARHMDFVSFSACPEPLESDPADLAFSHDVQRGLSGGRPWLLMSQPASHVACRPYNPVKRPGQMRLWTYQAVAHGSDGAVFSHWRTPAAGPEKFNSGVISTSAADGRLFREAAQLGAELKKISSVAGSLSRAEVALIIDPESRRALELDTRPVRLDYLDVLRAYYRGLFEPDVPIDIVSADHDLSPYRIVVAPLLFMVRSGVAENLQAFVEAGGTLVMTFLSGWVDASDRLLNGGIVAPFRRLLGLAIEESDPFGNQVRHIKTPLRGARCTLWADVIRSEGAETVATFTEDFYAHRPAITRNAVGRGLAYYIGTHPEPGFLRTFLAELCVDCGVRPPMRVPAGVEVTSRSNEHGEFLFLLNHTTTIQFVDLGPRIRRDLFSGEMIKGQCQLGPRDVRVLQLA
jgi:beta-galactosidase